MLKFSSEKENKKKNLRKKNLTVNLKEEDLLNWRMKLPGI